MLRLAPVCLAALLVLVTACGGDDGDSRHFGGDDASDDTALTGDIGFADTLGKDQAAPDGVLPDAQADDVPACESTCAFIGARECVDGTTYRVCQPAGVCLAWTGAMACAADEACDGGECVKGQGPDCSGLPTGCDTPGAKRCSADAQAVEQCNAAYECPKWDVVESCQPGKPCVNGKCGTGGVGVCAQLEACVDTACAEAVVTGSNIKLLKCTLESCRTEYEGCMGAFGSGSCKDLLKCAQACQNQECQKACTTEATYDANVQFVSVGVCLEDNCPGALEDPMSNLGCVTGTCGTPLNACCGGSIMNCM